MVTEIGLVVFKGIRKNKQKTLEHIEMLMIVRELKEWQKRHHP